MPKDQRTKWREAKQRYRAGLKEQQSQGPTEDNSDNDDDGFWTN